MTDEPTMTGNELRAAQAALGLSDAQIAPLLGLSAAYQVRRFKVDPAASSWRPLRPWHVRLLQAYLAGYRPADWPQPKHGRKART